MNREITVICLLMSSSSVGPLQCLWPPKTKLEQCRVVQYVSQINNFILDGQSGMYVIMLSLCACQMRSYSKDSVSAMQAFVVLLQPKMFLLIFSMVCQFEKSHSDPYLDKYQFLMRRNYLGAMHLIMLLDTIHCLS